MAWLYTSESTTGQFEVEKVGDDRLTIICESHPNAIDPCISLLAEAVAAAGSRMRREIEDGLINEVYRAK